MLFKVFGRTRKNKAILLKEFDTSQEATAWAEKYIINRNTRNWKHIQVLDTRGVKLTLWQWSSPR